MDDNDREGICYPQPRTSVERPAIARDFVKRFRYALPLAVDRIENPAERMYAGWPERLHVVDERGVIACKGKPGPFGYHPGEVEAWLATRFASQRSGG